MPGWSRITCSTGSSLGGVLNGGGGGGIFWGWNVARFGGGGVNSSLPLPLEVWLLNDDDLETHGGELSC